MIPEFIKSFTLLKGTNGFCLLSIVCASICSFLDSRVVNLSYICVLGMSSHFCKSFTCWYKSTEVDCSAHPNMYIWEVSMSYIHCFNLALTHSHVFTIPPAATWPIVLCELHVSPVGKNFCPSFSCNMSGSRRVQELVTAHRWCTQQLETGTLIYSLGRSIDSLIPSDLCKGHLPPFQDFLMRPAKQTYTMIESMNLIYVNHILAMQFEIML